MPTVPDASPFIALGKIERVELLPQLYGRVMVAPQVWEEAVTAGRATGAADAAYLEKAAAELRFVRVRLTPAEKTLAQRLTDRGCGSGEAQVLAVAKGRKALAILDDKAARAGAVGLGVDHVGTVGVLYEAFLRRMLSYDELIEGLEKLGKVAWVSPDLVAGIIRRAREVREK